MQELISKEEERVYMAEDIQKILNIGRSKTYEYLKEVFKTQEPFRVVKIGKLFRVPKRSFDNWISVRRWRCKVFQERGIFYRGRG